MKPKDDQRARRVALALLVRRHLIEYPDLIKAAYLKEVAEGRLPKPTAPESEVNGDEADGENEGKKPGLRASTALARLVRLDTYQNQSKGKPEAARQLFVFMQSAGQANFPKIYAYFKTVVTSTYRAEAPPYIQLAIYEVFDKPYPSDATEVPTADASSTSDEPSVLSHYRRSAPAIISAIEETYDRFSRRAAVFEGTWNVIRYSHYGERVVRLGMQVTNDGLGHRNFKLYFRTRQMTTSSDRSVRFTTNGCLFVLKGGEHVLFFGQEEAGPADPMPEGYPLSIICPTRIVPAGPFIGLVKRRHDDGTVFAIKAQFLRAEPGVTLEDLFAQGRVGSWEDEHEIAERLSDIPNHKTYLAQLIRGHNDRRGGLVLDSKPPSSSS